MRSSLRLECQSQIVRPPKEQYIETYNYPFEKRVEAVSYYNRRKRQLKAKNVLYHHPENKDASTDKISYDLSVEHEDKNIRGFADMIMEVSVEPVFNENKFISFNPELYPLSESQKVKVVEEKYFSLQNYYNYICAMKSQEEVFRLAEETQKRAKEVLEKKLKRGAGDKYFEAGASVDFDERRGPVLKETRKIKGNYESRFDPSGRYTSEEMVSKIVDLSPIHFDYDPGQGNNRLSTPFDLKEIQREKRLQQIAQKSRRR